MNYENDMRLTNQNISIGQLVESVTKLTGQRCTPAMIYNYEKHGLIPEPKRTEGGFRLFSIDDIQRVACIKRWQKQNMSLAQIKSLIEMENCGDEFDLKENIEFLPVDKRSQILEAAEAVFPRKGYAFTTLQDVADEAGISSSAIYQHFDSKEELFLALTEKISFVHVLETIDAALKKQDVMDFHELRQTLIDVARAFVITHTNNIEILRMFIAESREYPDVGIRYCLSLIDPMEDLLEQFLKKHANLEIFREVDFRIPVRAFFGMFSNFFMISEMLHGKEVLHFPLEESVEGMVDIFLNGLLNLNKKPSN